MRRLGEVPAEGQHIALEDFQMVDIVPHYKDHLLLQFGGWLHGGGTPFEEWSCSLRLAPTAGGFVPPQVIDQDAWLADAASDVKNYFLRATTKISDSAQLVFCKLNWIGVDGKYKFPESMTHLYPAPQIFGAGGSLKYPTQVALTVSLRCEKRGPRHRGRYYLPVPTVSLLSSDFHISTTDRDGVATSTKTFIEDLNNWPGIDPTGDVKVVIASGMSKVDLDGNNEEVKSIRVGNVLDTVRRRRRGLVESYKELLIS